MTNQGTMRIGEVHAILRRDVPDIELSKIRYYEDKGLVQPTRSRKGYRLYSQRDVDCLREAIRLAHEEFVPLRVVRLRLIEQGLLDDTPVAAGTRQVARTTSNVISVPVPVAESVEDAATSDSPASQPNSNVESPLEHVAELPEGEVEPSEPSQLASLSEPAPAAALVAPVLERAKAIEHPKANVVRVTSADEFEEWDDETHFFSHAEFLEVSGLDASVMNQLVASGMLCPETIANQSTFNDMDLRVASALKALLARNVDIRLLGSLRRNVEREIGLLNDVIQPVRPSKRAQSAREAHDTAKSVALELAALRSELFARALRQYLGH